jgi:predicted DNA-binding ribbon-helix-helix protein
MTTPKTPGRGLRILKVRSTNGTPEALILPPDHEAPFWTDLRQIAQHKARTIYESVIPSTK